MAIEVTLSVFTVLAAVLGLIVTSLVATLLYFSWRNVRAAPSNAPPVWRGGWPAVGHFLSFASSPTHTIAKGRAANGPVFTMRFLGHDLTFLIGVEAQAPFYDARDTDLSQNEPYRFMTPVFGPGIVFDAPIAVKRQQLTFVSKALKGDALKAYVPLILSEADEFFSTRWGASGEVDLLDEMSYLIILTASRCLLGREVRENLFGDVYHLLREIDEGINPIAMFFPHLPLPMFRRRDAARKRIGEIFSGIIKARRDRGAHEDDMLSLFMEAEYNDGSRCTDEQITGLLLAALFAGQHTSSISTTWTTLNLLANPPLYARAMEELVTLQGADPASTSSVIYDVLMKMDFLHNSMKESLRLAPPLIMLMRAVHTPLQVGKYTVPVGHYVVTSPAVTMNLPAGPDTPFTSPERFDPDRYTKGREEDKKGQYAYTAFGGGPHRCLGEQFGYLQVKTVLSLLLRRFVLTPLDPLPSPNYTAMVVGPTQPCRVRYTRRTTPLAPPYTIPAK